MSLKIDILKSFLDNKELCDSMKACDHGDTPYHLEFGIWTHTMLTYNQADPDRAVELIMALCHDIGKVATRQVKDNGKVSFYGHADASIQPTIDFVYRLYKEGIITEFLLAVFMKWGLPAMASHMLYYQNIDKKYHFIGDSPMIKHYLNRIADMDAKGSLCKEAKVKESLTGVKYKEYIPKQWNNDLPTITIWTGLPGSGKDYLAEKTGNPILSFDDIRVEVYNKTTMNIHSHLTEDEIYARAFTYCNENKIDLMKLMKRDAKYLLDEGKDINICNTSLTRKSRKTIINTIGPKYNYVVKQVFAPLDVIMSRNESRTSKTVPEEVIERMCKNMTIATHFEPHINNIEYLLNI